MLYLSRIQFATRHNEVLAEVHDCCCVHQRLLQAFPDGTTTTARADYGVLYRLDGRGQVLVQSHITPDWTRLPARLLHHVEMKDVNPRFVAGQRIRFQITANPTRRVTHSADHDSRRVPLLASEDQRDWWRRQSERAGLATQTVRLRVDPSATGWHRTQRRVEVHRVTYGGLAQVTDPDALMLALRQGIGHEKAYGCGLLSLARATEED